MPCCTNEPENIDPEEKAKRDKAIELVEKCLKDISELGYYLHTGYSLQRNFFIEKR